jgi:16S rRNA (adenine1518-N6/adenine1519-N6)-dimethyltransferase
MTKQSAHAYTMALLKDKKLKAKKQYGQNFIIDPSTVKKIAELSEAQGKSVIEVGPGLGALTEQLSLIAKEVTAFEIDQDVLSHLHQLFEDTNVRIVHQDFLKVTNNDFKATHLVGNLPYYITTPILFHVLEDLEQIEMMTIMVQKEVADRFSAKVNTKDYNALSIILNTLCEVKLAMKVSPHVFVPKPNVDSAVVTLKRRPNVSAQALEDYFRFVKKAFTQRRKTLTNNLKEYPHLTQVLIDMNLSLSIRAEALTKEQFEELYQRLR